MNKILLAIIASITCLYSCQNNSKQDKNLIKGNDSTEISFKLYEDPNRFADIELLRYDVPSFDQLTLQQKKLVYYLSEAAICGRDIIFDQNNKFNLVVRKTLEELYVNYQGDRKDNSFLYFESYIKRFWVSNGIHHHYAEVKLTPEFSSNYLLKLFDNSPKASLPLLKNQDTVTFKKWFVNLLFNPNVEYKRVNKAENIDQIKESANNFYEGVSQSEVEEFYHNKKKKEDTEPISWGLNSKLVKENGNIIEKVWKEGGMYGNCISKMIFWLNKAITVSENPEQKKSLELLVNFYQTGDLKKWDEYNIAWVKDVNSSIDVINGFIEVYHDPLGMRANFESAIEIKDFEASDRMKTLAENAQWFESNSPIDPAFKKEKVTGISYKVVNVAFEAGDLAPTTAIGINLPNAEWIREKHGSKSVSLGNITDAYEKANSGNMLEEFCWDQTQIDRSKQYGQLAAKMHTALHEVIGHASGKMMPGITKDNLGAYGSTLEEARADLVALYYIIDPKLVELKLIPSIEVGKAEYDDYIRNGLMVQLRRIQENENIEEDHMRNRQLVALWAYEKGKSENVIEKKIKNGKTYFVVNDYEKLRTIFGELLNLIQTIKSKGDFNEAKNLVETYGVKVNKNIHIEVLKRMKLLDVAAYRGFIQPKFNLIMEGNEIKDIKLEYNESFVDQMLRYSKNYSYLPYIN